MTALVVFAGCTASHERKCMSPPDEAVYTIEYGAASAQCSQVTELQLLPSDIGFSFSSSATILRLDDRTITTSASRESNGCKAEVSIQVQLVHSNLMMSLAGPLDVSDDQTLRGTLALLITASSEGPSICTAKIPVVFMPAKVSGTAGAARGRGGAAGAPAVTEN
jgi:hypothetical protein